MNRLVVSDIHGDEKSYELLRNIISIEDPVKIYLLGDIMSSYLKSDELIKILNEYKDRLLLIRGNCDVKGVISQDMLDYYQEYINGRNFLFTHGHLLNYIPTEGVDIIVAGHTHKNAIGISEDGIIYFNPGSIAYPRGGSENSYGIITDDELIIKDINHNKLKCMKYTK